MTTLNMEQVEGWIDRQMIDKHGRRLGTVSDVYVDDASGVPEWLAVMTGLFGSRISFVPIVGVVERGDKVQVAHERSLVKDSPNIEADGELTEEEEGRLYRHYGLPHDLPGAADLRRSGSETARQHHSAEAARLRLRKHDAEAVDAIDLRGEEVTQRDEQTTGS